MDTRSMLARYYVDHIVDNFTMSSSDIVITAFPSINKETPEFREMAQEVENVANTFKTWIVRVGTSIRQTPQRVFMASEDDESVADWVLSSTLFYDSINPTTAIYVTKENPDYLLARTAASVVINNFVQVWNDPAEPSFVIFDERHLPQFVLDEGAMTIPSVSCKTPANLKKWKATTAFIGSFGSQLVDLKTSELIAFINREAPYPNLVDEKLVKAFQKRASKFSDVDYSSVEYNVFDGWTFKEKGVLSAPVAITIGQFTGHTLTPRQRKATVLFVELHGEKLVTLQQDDVPDFVTQQSASTDNVSIVLICQLLATLKHRGSVQGDIDFSTINFDRYMGWHFDLKRSASWSNKQQAKIFSTTIPKMFSTQVLRQLSGHLHPANVLSAILFNLGFTAGQIKSAVSGTDMAFKESYLERDGHRERFTCSERTQQAVLLLNQVRWQIVQGYTVARLIASGVLFYRDVLPEDAVAIVAPVKRKAVPQPCVSKRRRLEPEQTIKDLCDRVDKLKERVSATGKNVGKMRSSILKKLVNITRKLDTILG